MKKFTLFDLVNYSVAVIFSAFCLLPMLLVVMISVTQETALKKYGYSFFPKEFSLAAYKMVFTGNPLTMNSYLVTVVVTLVGTVLAVAITAMGAYTLANRNVRYRNTLSLFFFVTMVFNPGLVPWYMMCMKLGLMNNIFSLIIPSLIFNPFNLFLAKNFMQGIPDSLMESAKIDGAGDFTIAWRVYFPLCKPVLATIALFYGLAYWNNWFNAIMLVNNKYLFPLQFMLYKLRSEIAMLNEIQGVSVAIDIPNDSFKMATAVITVGPIVMLYPYLQRYFIKGLVIGSVKG